MDEQTQTRIAIARMQSKIAELQIEIGELAAEGDTLGCDIRHSQIATLETAMAILTGEVDGL